MYALLAVSPAIFIFSVTLLGTAIEQSQSEERAARENAKTDVQKEIDDIDAALKKARKDGDTTNLATKLDELTNKRSGFEKEIVKLRKKYGRINLNNTVLYPCASFLLVILISPLMIYVAEDFRLEFLVLVVQFLLASFGLFKLYKSLDLVQVISASKKESDQFARLKDAIKTSLSEYYQSIKEETAVEFVDKAFPLNVTASMELEIRFRVTLTKGSALKNAFVWFYVADGFDLVDPSETSAWRQPANHSLPNIRTVQISLGTLSIGPATPRKIILKTPATPGKYLLRYAVRAEGYYGTSKDLTVLVG